MPPFSREPVATIRAGDRRIVVERATAGDVFALVLRVERQDGQAPAFIRAGVRQAEARALVAAILQAHGEPAPSPPSPRTAPLAAEDQPPKCAGQARRRHVPEAGRVTGSPPQSWIEMQSKGT